MSIVLSYDTRKTSEHFNENSTLPTSRFIFKGRANVMMDFSGLVSFYSRL